MYDTHQTMTPFKKAHTHRIWGNFGVVIFSPLWLR